MERIKVYGAPGGLGIAIIKMSLAMAIDGPVNFIVPDSANIAYELKKIFQIPDSKMIITVDPKYQRTDDILDSDELCVYTSYFYSHSILLDNRIHFTARKPKRCVALAMHHGRGLGNDLPLKKFPYNKFATQDEYNKIIEYLDSHGYSVITMNSPELTVQEKTHLLNEYCDCLITYEGGVAHLAHLLNIPTIILPWKYNDMGHPPIPPGIWYESHRYHPDRKTWFLKSVDELLSWSVPQFKEKIVSLYQDQGNNLLFGPTVTFDYETLNIQCHSPMIDLTPRISELSKKVLKELLPNPKIF